MVSQSVRYNAQIYDKSSFSQHQPSSLMDLFGSTLRGTFKRRRISIIIGFFIIFVPMAMVIIGLPNFYDAEARLLIDLQSQNLITPKDSPRQEDQNQFALRSEVEFLRSSSILGKVYDDISSKYGAEQFHGSIGWSPLKILLQAKLYISQVLAKIGFDVPNYLKVSFSEQSEATNNLIIGKLEVIEHLRTHIKITHIERTNVLLLSFRSQSAEISAEVLNSAMKQYKEFRSFIRQSNLLAAQQLIKSQMSVAEDLMRKSDEAIHDFINQQGLVSNDGKMFIEGSLTELYRQRVLAMTEQAQRQAELAELRGLLPKAYALGSSPLIQTNPTINALRSRQAELRQRSANLADQLGPRHPSVMQLNAEKDSISVEIREEIARIIDGKEREVNALKTSVQYFNEQVESLRVGLRRYELAEINLSEYRQVAESRRAVYRDLVNREAQIGSDQHLQLPPATIISSAEPPLRSAGLPKSVLFGVAGLISLSVGTGFGFLRQLRRNGITDEDELSAIVMTTHTASVPMISGTTNSLGDTTLLQAALSTIEAQCDSLARRGQAVLITSSVPEEGKSFLTVAMAAHLASKGKSVLIIDCDAQRPTIGDYIGVSSLSVDRLKIPGLTISTSNRMGIDTVSPAGCEAIGKNGGINRIHFNDLLTQVRQAYDVVLLDSPPVLAVSDASVLARCVESIIFAVRWERTPANDVSRSMQRLQHARASDFVGVLTQVDSRHGYHYNKKRKDRSLKRLPNLFDTLS